MTTQLQALNTMLSAIAAQPLAALDGGPYSPEVSSAITILDEITSAVQLEKWSFNYEYEVDLLRENPSNKIKVPSNATRIDVSVGFDSGMDVVQRGEWLYNRYKHTYVFTKDLKCDVLYELAWAELPVVAQRYVMVRAARVFANRVDGERLTHAFTQADEEKALSNLRKANADSADLSIFDTIDTYRTVNRPS